MSLIVNDYVNSKLLLQNGFSQQLNLRSFKNSGREKMFNKQRRIDRNVALQSRKKKYIYDQYIPNLSVYDNLLKFNLTTPDVLYNHFHLLSLKFNLETQIWFYYHQLQSFITVFNSIIPKLYVTAEIDFANYIDDVHLSEIAEINICLRSKIIEMLPFVNTNDIDAEEIDQSELQLFISGYQQMPWGMVSNQQLKVLQKYNYLFNYSKNASINCINFDDIVQVYAEHNIKLSISVCQNLDRNSSVYINPHPQFQLNECFYTHPLTDGSFYEYLIELTIDQAKSFIAEMQLSNCYFNRIFEYECIVG